MANIARAIAGDMAALCDSRTKVVRDFRIAINDQATPILYVIGNELRELRASSQVVECRYCGTQHVRGKSNKCSSCGGNIEM